MVARLEMPPKLRCRQNEGYEVGAYNIVSMCHVKSEANPTVGDKIRTLKRGFLVLILEILKVGSRARGRLADGGWITLSDDDRPELHWVERFPLPSMYRIDFVVHVKETQDLASAHKGDIPAGTEVNVLEVAAVSEQERIRARITAPVPGWFSIQSIDSIHCWATRIVKRTLGDVRRYCVDSAEVITSQEGVAYRCSPNIKDRNRSEGGKFARYGSIVSGIRYDPEWLQVGDQYLPFYIRGALVLIELCPGKDVGAPSVIPASIADMTNGAEKFSKFASQPIIDSEQPERLSRHRLGHGTGVEAKTAATAIPSADLSGSPVSELRSRLDARRRASEGVDEQPDTQEAVAKVPTLTLPPGGHQGSAGGAPSPMSSPSRRSFRFGGTLGESFKRLSATHDLDLDDTHHAVFNRLSQSELGEDQSPSSPGSMRR